MQIKNIERKQQVLMAAFTYQRAFLSAVVFTATLNCLVSAEVVDGIWPRPSHSLDGGARNWTTIEVSTNGNDTKACLTGIRPCKTIRYAIMEKESLNQTKIFLQGGIHELESVIERNNLWKFEIQGNSTSRPIIKCNSSQTGFYFGYSQELDFRNFDIENCGANFPSSNQDNRLENPKIWNISTSLHVKETTNMNMTDIKITGAFGYGAVFYDVVGNVFMKDVRFMDNVLVNSSSEPGFRSGGGIYIEFRPNCQQGNIFLNSNSTYLFKDCHFISNTAEYTHSAVSYSSCKQFLSYGRGGGISYFSRGTANNNKLNVDGCVFKSNHALWGGGIFAEFDDKTGNNFINVVNSQFANNNVTLGGGGMRIGINSNRKMGPNRVYVTGSEFFNNSAMIGGAYSQYRPEGIGKTDEKILMNNCTFKSNQADCGSAFLINLCHLHLINSTVESNTQLVNKGPEKGEGAVYCYSSTMALYGSNNFSRNEYSAVILETSYTILHDKVLFQNNIGMNGGAFALYGDSSIRITNKTILTFKGNNATKKGGAVYVEMPVSSQTPMSSTELKMHSCFFMFGENDMGNLLPEKSSSSTHFLGNHAPDASGSNVYADTISQCRKSDEPVHDNSALKWNVFQYEGGGNGSKTVVTTPVRISSIRSSQWNVYPGLETTVTVALLDENSNSVYDNVRVTVKPEKKNHVWLRGAHLFLVKEKMKIILLGKKGAKFSVKLDTITGPPVSKLITNLTLRRCPLGYYHSDQHNSCRCLAEKPQVIKIGVTKCDNHSSVHLLKGRWGDPKPTKCEDFAKHICPDNYCRSDDHSTEMDKLFDRKRQCEEGRDPNSVLCGKCLPNYSVDFGSEKCKPCTNEAGIAYLLLLLLFLTLVVIIIMLFNVDTYATSLNAFLYSYQIIPLCTHGNTYIDTFMRTVIGVATLSGSGKLGVGVCLWKGMNDLEKIALNYIIPFYMLLCTYVISSLSARFKNRCTFNRRTIFKSFVFISVIAYSDLTRITFDLLHPIKVRGTWVLYKAGFIEFFKAEHLGFGIFALFILVLFVLPFPFILMFSRFVTSNARFVRLMGIFDTFDEPFHRLPYVNLFSAFYFFNRLFLLLVYVFMPKGVLQDTIFAFVCLIILSIFLYIKPYLVESMNVYDSLLLFNISILAVINVGLNWAVDYRNALQITAEILTYAPILCAVIKVVIWGVGKFQNWNDAQRQQGGNRRRFTPLPKRLEEYDEDDDGNDDVTVEFR
eukprot:Seg2298.10 transcript_id=Seg2298.10/GoldUCD/mRNA.D3Y31 product="hypothetical protein" protein_id=Seg2298.10/GoldUCD/D3Y31